MSDKNIGFEQIVDDGLYIKFKFKTGKKRKLFDKLIKYMSIEKSDYTTLYGMTRIELK